VLTVQFQVHVHAGPCPVHARRLQELQSSAGDSARTPEGGSILQRRHHRPHPQPRLDPDDQRKNVGQTQRTATRVC